MGIVPTHPQQLIIWLISLVVIITGRFVIQAALAVVYRAVHTSWARMSRTARVALTMLFLAPVVAWLIPESNHSQLKAHLKDHVHKHGKLFFEHYFGALKPEDPALPLKRLLIVGEVGDGKSTMINALRDPTRSGEAEAGRSARGVTKQIMSYVGLPINGHPVELLDTPGVGDKDVTPTKLISMLEARLLPPIDGVLVTNPISDGRVKLGAQVVATIVDKGFVGEEKWGNVILVGTKDDRAEDDEQRRFFREDIMREFFAHAPNATGTVVLTSRESYDELRSAIAALPHMAVHYHPPDATMMAAALAESFGMRMDDFQRQLREERERMRTEYNEEIDRLRRESEARWNEAQLREARLEEALREAEARAQRAVGAAKVVAETKAAEVRAEFALQLSETKKLREDFDQKQELWHSMQTRLAEFEERELRNKEQEQRTTEQMRQLQQKVEVLRQQLAALEATEAARRAGSSDGEGGGGGGGGGGEGEGEGGGEGGGEDGAGGAGGGRLPTDDERKSALQRQLEATEEQLGSLVQLQELSLPLPLHASAHHGAEEQLGSLVQETLGSEGVHSGTLPFATVQAEAAQPKPKAPERPQAEQPANEEGDEHGAGEATGYDLPMDLPQQAEAPPTARLKEEL
jgi:predicted GTPase